MYTRVNECWQYASNVLINCIYYSITVYHVMSEVQELYTNRMDHIEEIGIVNGNKYSYIESLY